MKDIHIHIIPTANDDGSKAATETAAAVKEKVKDLNELYKQAGVLFIFDPESDFDKIRRSTLLNQDMFEQPQSVIDKWPLTEFDKIEYSKPLDDEKIRVGKEYPGKLVVFVGSGDRYGLEKDPITKKDRWVLKPDFSFNWSPGEFFVRIVLGSQPWNKYAHEISHYLQFGDNSCTIQGNVAGYYEPYNNITEEQVKTIRTALEPGGKQYHLTSQRVLYDAIWEPSNPGQTRVICWARDDFAVRFDKELALNRIVKSMQAYDIGGNNIRYDGVWESGKAHQTRAIMWAKDDFANRFNRELANGMHCVHMQAYDTGGNNIRYDGVWESGNAHQTRAIMWAKVDFANRFNQELANGMHCVHMQAYDIGGNNIRYDGVWESGKAHQTRAIMWAKDDFANRFNRELANGMHCVHMQAYDIGGNNIRYDGVWESGNAHQTRAIMWWFNHFVDRFDQELSNGRHCVHMQAYDIGDGQIRYDGVWEDGRIEQTRALGLDIGDFTVRLDNQLAKGKKIVHMQAYMRK